MPIYLPKPPIGAVLNKTHPLAKGLIGAWLMNDRGGTKVKDYSGNSHVGTFVQTPDWVPGGLNFVRQAAEEYVDVGNISWLGEMTVVCEIEFDDLTNTQGIFADTNALGEIEAYHLEFGRTDKRLSAGHDNAVIATSNTDLSTATRYQVAAVRTGSGTNWTWSFYVNGKPDGSGSTAVKAPVPSTSITAIGNHGELVVATLSFDGRVYWLYFYGRALGQSDIYKLYYDPYCMFEQRVPIWMLYQQPAAGMAIPLISGGLVNDGILLHGSIIR